MAKLVLHGIPASSYVRAARMTCIEKGVPHELEKIDLGSDSHRELHPFLRVPAMTHGSVRLYETSAITRYVNKAFEGPSLVPASAADEGLMEQWISAINCYLYGDLVKSYALQYIVPLFRGQTPDRAKIDAAVPALQKGLAQIDAAYDGRDWIAGTFSLADLFVGPVLTTVSLFPEGKAALEGSKNLPKLLERLRKRKSAEFIDPPMPKS